VVDPRAIRLNAGMTQSELAERLEQARVSRFERQADWKISTLTTNWKPSE
jgi:hypothetical protein